MTANSKYLLDANALIEANRRYYSSDICPGFWNFLEFSNGNAAVFSIDRIGKEIHDGAGRDFLKEWVGNNSAFFLSTDISKTINHYRAMVSWVSSSTQFLPEAKAEFASVADGWLIAHARAEEYVLVTHEICAKDARKKVPIPNVCKEFGVRYCNTFEMLRILKAKFILG